MSEATAGELDVRALQTLITRVLSGASYYSQADVNQDGVVDVRDLQRLLSGGGNAEEPEMPQRSSAPLKAVTPLPPGFEIILIRPAQRSYLLEDLEPRRAVPIADLFHPPRETERYRCALTPHAPPLRVIPSQDFRVRLS